MSADIQKESTVFEFRGPHSGAQRIWHWGSSLAIIALLCTVLIASTLLKPRNNVHKIQDKLQEKGVNVTSDQAKAVAKSIGHPIWVWHKYIGVGLAVLFLFRIILEFFEPEGQSLRARIRKGALYLRQMPGDKNTKHYLFVKYFYLLFYLMIFIMVSTGLCLIYADDVDFIHTIEENIKDIHSAVMYGVMGFIVLHIAGLMNSELGPDPGITADMINGNKR
ncbi:MAG TPA: cytochrome b/b6 domain-containing protein [Bacteroidia bacterium]|nr:cytochrome b/b6 domain-containing protein [Bacteroidia bacterium]